MRPLLAFVLVTSHAVGAQAGRLYVELDEPERARQAELFAASCASCHAADGAGGRSGLPDLTDARFLGGRTNHELLLQLERGCDEGKARVDFGSDAQAADLARLRIVAFVRTLGARGGADPNAEAEGPAPIVPVTVRPGLPFYANEAGIAGGVRGLLLEKNYEEVYRNYTFYEAWYDEAGRVLTFKEYRRGEVLVTESYSYDEQGRLVEKRVIPAEGEPRVLRFPQPAEEE